MTICDHLKNIFCYFVGSIMDIQLDKENKSLNRSMYLLIFVCVVLSVIFSIVPDLLTETNLVEVKPLDTVVLQLKWRHQFQFAGYYAAVEKGYYKQAGLDVRIIEAKPGDRVAETVLDGQADFGIGMSDLITLRAQDQPVVALATIYQHSPTVIAVLKKNGINNILDLMGKRVIFEPSSTELLAFFRSVNLPLNKIINDFRDYSMEKLISGEVDAISVYSTDAPFTLLEKGLAYKTFSPRDAGIDFYGDTLFTSERQISKHPKRVEAFLNASLEGWKYALANTEETVDMILSKYSKGYSRKHLLFQAEMSKKLIMPDLVDIGYMSMGRWMQIANTFKKLNQIPPNFSLEGFIYDRYSGKRFYWLYASLAIVIVIALLLFWVSRRFYLLTMQLNIEMAKQDQYIEELKKANEQIKTLSGIIPVCMHCKGIRDSKGYWQELEKYIIEYSEAEFSHSICKDCLEKLHPEFNIDEI